MRVLAITDGIGNVDAVTAAATADEGWRATTEDTLDLIPINSGGPGFLRALAANLEGQMSVYSLPGPLRTEVPATVFTTTTNGAKTAYIEAAEVCGLHLVPAAQRDPRRTTSRGVAQLLEAAVETGASRIIIGVGGTATNDAGSGMLAGLGVGAPEKLDQGPERLAQIQPGDLDFGPARELLAGVDLIAACATGAPLLGFTGASGAYAQFKGATREIAQELERVLAQFASVCEAVDSAAPAAPGGLLTPGEPQAAVDVAQLRSLPGAGSGGGLGFALGLLGARLLPGSEVVASLLDVRARAQDSDLVFVITDQLDATTLGDGPSEIGVAAARTNALATVALARRVDAGNRELATAGISAAYELFDTVSGSEASDEVAALRERVSRIARSWSR
ncbi:MAG TPA: glycerate kinase [Actinomycetales bacterium]|nr:glycerate kinase [Actinomycetales bacterium]